MPFLSFRFCNRLLFCLFNPCLLFFGGFHKGANFGVLVSFPSSLFRVGEPPCVPIYDVPLVSGSCMWSFFLTRYDRAGRNCGYERVELLVGGRQHMLNPVCRTCLCCYIGSVFLNLQVPISMCRNKLQCSCEWCSMRLLCFTIYAS